MSTDTDIEARARVKAHQTFGVLLSCPIRPVVGGHDVFCNLATAAFASHGRELAEVRETSDERYREARELERRAQTYSDMAENLRGRLNEAKDANVEAWSEVGRVDKLRLAACMEVDTQARAHDEALLEVSRLTASLASMTVERDEAVARLGQQERRGGETNAQYVCRIFVEAEDRARPIMKAMTVDEHAESLRLHFEVTDPDAETPKGETP